MVPSTCVSPFLRGSCSKEKALNTDGSRISIAQLLQIGLGCIFHEWRETAFSAEKVAELLRDLWKYCKEENHLNTMLPYWQPSSKSWLASLADAAENHLAADGITKTEYTRLFNYGRRRCPEFLGVTQKSPSSIVAL